MYILEFYRAKEKRHRGDSVILLWQMYEITLLYIVFFNSDHLLEDEKVIKMELLDKQI